MGELHSRLAAPAIEPVAVGATAISNHGDAVGAVRAVGKLAAVGGRST